MKNNLNKHIKQVIIVEGKSDTQKLQQIFGVDLQTIETHGLALDENTIKLINQVSLDKGVIILTDPDGPGKKIREQLNQELTGDVRNAFITKKDIKTNSKKIGIAEADDKAIIEALDNLISFSNNKPTLSWQQYLDNDFYLKNNRRIICNYFKFDENLSSKTLFKWLNLMGLKVEDIKKIVDDEKKKGLNG